MLKLPFAFVSLIGPLALMAAGPIPSAQANSASFCESGFCGTAEFGEAINSESGVDPIPPQGDFDDDVPTRTVYNDGIYPPDDRVALTSTQYGQFPYRCVTYIVCGVDYDGDGITDDHIGGTGFLVGPNILMTAGHMVRSSTTDWITSMTAYVGCTNTSNTSSALASASATQYWCGNYYSTGNPNDDWAFVKLNANLGYTYGYFDVFNLGLSNGTPLTMIGYQGDLGYATIASDEVRGTPGTYSFYHRIDAYAGASGSPIFYGNTNIVVGIHSSGIHYENNDYNIGCRISSYLLQYTLALRSDWAL